MADPIVSQGGKKSVTQSVAKEIPHRSKPIAIDAQYGKRRCLATVHGIKCLTIRK